MQPRFLINGHSSTELSVQDRGLHYGDGVFETIAVDHGEPLLWQAHMQRLSEGCQKLSLPSPNTQELLTQVKSLCAEADRAVLKIIVTRGSGGRGYSPPVSPQPSQILALYPWPEYSEHMYTTGVDLFACHTPYGRNPFLAKIKHLNRLEQVLARSELHETPYFEGLVFDTEGMAIEGTMSNLFIRKNDTLSTPDLHHCGIEGIIRNEIIHSLNEQHRSVRVTGLTEQDVMDADEVFLCNSIAGIISVKSYRDTQYDDFSSAISLRTALTHSKALVAIS